MRRPATARFVPLLPRVVCVLFCAGQAWALELDKLKVQRKEVFEFTEKPAVTSAGDRVTISFGSKDFCDATVAIEDAQGRIIRHLASGVLGKNAPPPFQKDSLKQAVLWDSKDEIGRYVDDKSSLTVRVSLGLKPQFERTLYWAAQKLSSGYRSSSILMFAAPDGMCVLFKGRGDQMRLFDHQGNYVRTIYPFPANKIDQVKGLNWLNFPPDNERFPDKLFTHDQDTFLPDKNARIMRGYGDRIVVAGAMLTFLAKDGTSGGVETRGAEVAFRDNVNAGEAWPIGHGEGPTDEWLRPNSGSLSPDGKRMYFTAYVNAFSTFHRSGGWNAGFSMRHGVAVVDLETGAKPTPFTGVMKRGKEGGAGKDNEHFCYPKSVECDSQGRVYVADNLNNRLQVFDRDGTYLKTIPTDGPGSVQINRKTGEIWVTSSGVEGSTAYDVGGMGWDQEIARQPPIVVRKYRSFEDPQEVEAYPLTTSDSVNVEIDFFTDPPTFWTSSNTGGGIRLCQIEGRKLVVKRDLAAEAEKAMVRPRAPRWGRPRLYVNPATGLLYLGMLTWDCPVDTKSFREVVVMNPATGKNKVEQLPTNPEDIGFDCEGRAYLRTHDAVVRFDPVTWREIPYDYGDERIVFFDDGGPRKFTSSSALIMPGSMGCMFHQGGLGVAPNGTIVVSCVNPASANAAERKRMAEKNIHVNRGRKPYTPPVYPGRNPGWETHIFDIHGKLLKADAVPGIDMSNFLQIDRDNSVYVLAASTPYLDGKPYFNGRGCTLFKAVPGRMKGLTPGGTIPLAEAAQPKRPMDMTRPGIWVEGAEWLFGPVGADGHYGSGGKCDCYVNARFALDYFGRSFAPEVDRFRAVVLDSSGNVITRIGKYGNVEDGMPLVKPDPALANAQGAQPLNPRSIGGDEVAIMHAMNVAVDTNRRFFLADIGNQCIRSVKLGYHAEERVTLKDVKDTGGPK